MKSRRKAREAALQALYQCDTLSDWSESVINIYFKVFQPEAAPNGTANTSVVHEASDDEPVVVETVPEHTLFARELVNGVAQFLDFIDRQISGASTRWSVKRMSRVDRNIIRLAGFEIAFRDDIPVSVSINEAIEIAKVFGTDDSPMFVNGVLDQMASLLRDKPEMAQQAIAQYGPVRSLSSAA